MDLIFGLFFIEITIELELFFFFLSRIRSTDDKLQRKLVVLLGIYFLLLAVGRSFLIYYDFYTSSTLTFYYNIGTGLSLLGMVFFILLAENIVPKKTYYLFSLLGCATLLAIFFVDLQTAKSILYVMIPFIFLIGFTFLTYLIRMTSGSVRYNFILIFFGQLLFGVGQGLNTDWISNWFLSELSFEINYIALMTIIGGLGLIALGFWHLPSFSEIEWHSKMLQLFVITNTHGICCFHFAFRQSAEEQQDSDLISSGVTGIIAFIKEITSSKKNLKEVDHEDVQMLFEYGEHTVTALLTEELLEVYHHKLKKFVERFEEWFLPMFKDWTGSMNEFQTATDLVEQIFEYKEKNLQAASD